MNTKILNKPIAMAEITLILNRLWHSLYLFKKTPNKMILQCLEFRDSANFQGAFMLSSTVSEKERKKKKGDSLPSYFYEANIILVPSKTSTVQEQKVIDKCHVWFSCKKKNSLKYKYIEFRITLVYMLRRPKWRLACFLDLTS